MTGKKGKAVPNQFIITGNEQGGYNGEYSNRPVTYFQSYNSLIVKQFMGKIYLDRTTWNYSRTTSRYRNQFLGMTTKEIKAKIKSGEIQLVNLND